MGVMFDYFAAPSDEVAAAVIGTGPTVAVADPDLVLESSGIEPSVQMATLEELLTGRPYDSIVDDPRSAALLASADDDACLVLTLTDELQAALAGADPQRLLEVAGPWSRTEEFWGRGEPELLADFLGELAALARRAAARGHRLYCWTCL
jgi:hypothetical protein